MSDHYRTLGLQFNASKRDIKNAYFRLAHSYHPDHHAKADAAGRAAAAVWFRKVKDAYEVLSDDRRRDDYDYDYDRIIRSSFASGGGYGNRQHGPYGGGDSSRSTAGSTSSSTEPDSEWIWKRTRTRCNGGGTYSSSSGHSNRSRQYIGSSARASSSGFLTPEWEAAWKKMEEKIAKWEAQEAVEKAKWEAQKAKWNSQKEKREAEYEAEWKVQKAKWKAENEKREAQKEKQEAEWEVEREKRQGHDGGPSSSLSGEDTSSSSMESDSSASATWQENWQHRQYGGASSHSSGQKHGGEFPRSNQSLWGFAKSRGFHSRTISTREEWEAEVKSLWRGDSGWESEWKLLWERVKQTRRDGCPMDWAAEWESLQEGISCGRTRRHSGGAYSSSGSHENRQRQYSSWVHSGTSSTASNGQGGTLSSSTYSNGHGNGGPRSRPPPWVPWPMVGGIALVVCCVAWRICTSLEVQQAFYKEATRELDDIFVDEFWII